MRTPVAVEKLIREISSKIHRVRMPYKQSSPTPYTISGHLFRIVFQKKGVFQQARLLSTAIRRGPVFVVTLQSDLGYHRRQSGSDLNQVRSGYLASQAASFASIYPRHRGREIYHAQDTHAGSGVTVLFRLVAGARGVIVGYFRADYGSGLPARIRWSLQRHRQQWDDASTHRLCQ